MTDDPSYTFTWFREALDSRHGRRITSTPDEIQQQLRSAAPWHNGKSALPLICTATFAGDHRGNARVEVVHMLGLDIDEPQADPAATIAAISAGLGGVEVFGYSTFSSSAGAYKLRGLVPYDRPATGDEHRASWALVAGRVARCGVNVDRACSDPARGFYVWAVPPSGVYWQGHVAGDPWKVGQFAGLRMGFDAAREADVRAHRARLPVRDGGDAVKRARAYAAKMDPAISGSGGSRATFVACASILHGFELSEDQALAVMLDEFNPRCQPPWTVKDLERKVREAAKARDFERGSLLRGRP